MKKIVPSLAQIAADPSKIATLDPLVAAALGAAFSGLATSCAFRAAMARPPVPVRDGDRALSLTEAADLLGVHPKTLARRAQHPPFDGLRLELGVRRLRFSESRVVAYLQQRFDDTLGSPTSRPDPAGGRKAARGAQPLSQRG